MESHPKRADQAPNANLVHLAMMANGTLSRLIA
jgi:hypothetical protein